MYAKIFFLCKWVISWDFSVLPYIRSVSFLCFYPKDYRHCFWYDRTNSNLLEIATDKNMTLMCPTKGLGPWFTIKFMAWHFTKKIKKSSVIAPKSSHQGQWKLSLARSSICKVEQRSNALGIEMTLLSPLAKVHRSHNCFGTSRAAGQRKHQSMPQSSKKNRFSGLIFPDN